jgi:hypothetical protein
MRGVIRVEVRSWTVMARGESGVCRRSAGSPSRGPEYGPGPVSQHGCDTSLVYQLITSIAPVTTYAAGTTMAKGATPAVTTGQLTSATVKARLLDFAWLDRRTTAETATVASTPRGALKTSSGKRTDAKQCTYAPCGKTGHLELECYMKK